MINRFGAGPGKSVIIRHQRKLSKIKQTFQSNSIKLFRTEEFNAVGHRTKANTELFSCVCVFLWVLCPKWYRLQNRTVMVQDDLGLQTWRVNIFPWYTFHRESVFRVNSEYGNTVEPVYNGHPRDLRNWPLIFSLIYTDVTIPYFISLMVRNLFWIGSSLFRSWLVIG